MSLATVSIAGRIVKPLELIRFPSGRSKTTLVVAVSQAKKEDSGQSADFYRVEVWGKLAETCVTYLDKGSHIAACGRLILDRWTDKNGASRITPVVNASQLSFLSRKSDSMDSHVVANPTLEEEIVGADEAMGLEGCLTEEIIDVFQASNLKGDQLAQAGANARATP